MKLELTITHKEVEAIVKQWVNKNYQSLEFESITTLTGVNTESCMEFGDKNIPLFKGFKIHVKEKGVK